mmetsp:Transcript_4845/g.5248  ORF Transcript_4845/g.5248 Transcript_4845/m.5248 type:complete len:180 (+) Transcript_4845:3-542(+)
MARFVRMGHWSSGKKKHYTYAQISTNKTVFFKFFGGEGIGKTSIALRFCKNKFRDQAQCSVDEKQMIRSVPEAKDFKARFCEKSTFSPTVFLICFSIIDRSSYEYILKRWPKHGYQHHTAILVGTHSDCNASRTVSVDEVNALAKEKSLKYFECSSKTGENVLEAVVYLMNRHLNSISP